MSLRGRCVVDEVRELVVNFDALDIRKQRAANVHELIAELREIVSETASNPSATPPRTASATGQESGPASALNPTRAGGGPERPLYPYEWGRQLQQGAEGTLELAGWLCSPRTWAWIAKRMFS